MMWAGDPNCFPQTQQISMMWGGNPCKFLEKMLRSDRQAPSGESATFSVSFVFAHGALDTSPEFRGLGFDV